MELEELKTLLETFKGDVKTAIDEKTKAQSDAANAEIAVLKTKLEEAEKALNEIKEQSKKSFGLPGLEAEKQRFSWAKYFVGLANDFRANKGIGDPDTARKFWETTGSFEHRVCKDYNAADGSSGGFLVPPEIYKGDVIDTVYANTAIMKMPVLKFENLKGDLPIPVDSGNLTAYHLSETEAPTRTSASFELKWLRPKKIGIYVRVSNRLLDQTNNAIEMIVKNKMALDASVELSRALTNGIGANSEGAGIYSFYNSMTGTANLAANGRRFTIDDLADMKQTLAAANELRDTNTYGAIMRPEVKWGMIREKTEIYSGQPARNGHPKLPSLLIDQNVIESATKLLIGDTTQVPLNTVGDSSTNSRVIVGDWSKFVYASFRDPIFRVSDVASDSSGRSALLNDEIFMVMFFEYDCNCLRPAAFTGRGGAETNKSNW